LVYVGRSRSLAATLLVLLSLCGCGLFDDEPTPEQAARSFLTAMAAGDNTTASNATDDPQAATALLDKVRNALKPTAVQARFDQIRDSGDGTAEASFTTTWTLGDGREWAYPGTMRLHRDESRPPDRRWVLRWSPEVVHPKLAAQQTLAVRELQPDSAPIVDRDGAPLLAPERVVSVLLYREEAGNVPPVADALAAALSPLDATITAQAIVDGAAKATSGNGYQVALLREADYQGVKPRIYDLPGVRFSLQVRLLPTAGKDFAKQLLPALRTAVEEQTTGKAGWQVVSLNAAGADVDILHEQRPKPGVTVTTTLSRATQLAAENAVRNVPQQAMIVAIQASTGEVLAVAQNAAADAAGPLALTGRYPPGSTFKIVTAAAALQAGVANAGSPLPCPGTMAIDGRLVPNINRFDLGTVPLHTAFANSCNTTFARLAADLPPAALPDAARQLGLGVDFVMPGATTITGSVPPGATAVERAEAGFGQGKVVASPFGLALAAATVASGRPPVPTLIRGSQTTADAAPAAPPPAVLDALRPMMREVVTAGSGTGLAGVPGEVHGKTGTAQFGDGTHSHGWFVGYRGDVAFAVLVVDGGASAPAVAAAARFLTAIP
jgi:Penicillin binding protein transpeptidase domain/NTF2-like N-terminal transpeptidase domain